MRKWRNISAPDDPEAWYDVSNFWPTKRGTYETADSSTATEISTAGVGPVIYAFAAQALSGTREYLIANNKILEYSAGAFTDRTNGLTLAAITRPMMAQYGNITILVLGTAVATASSSGGNFSALAGAPKAEIVVVQSNAVVMFNTDTSADGWAASDVGDYTNWSTGEAASGRITTTPGPIIAAVPFGNDIIVFKQNAIYRMTYVGGVVKWLIQLAWAGMGAYPVFDCAKYQVAATASGVVFNGQVSGASLCVYVFDGVSRPRFLNPETSIVAAYGETVGAKIYSHIPVFFYDPVEDVLCIADSQGAGGGSGGGDYFYYSFASDMWGHGSGASGEAADTPGTTNELVIGVVQGDYYAQSGSSRPTYYRYGDTNQRIRRCVPSAPGSSSVCYLQTSMSGTADRKTRWTRLIPLLRRRTDLGTDSAALSFTLYREREDTSAATTNAVSESSLRKRFDLAGAPCADNFARFKVTWTAIDAEVDDVQIEGVDAGSN